jgi:hypothetical protein
VALAALAVALAPAAGSGAAKPRKVAQATCFWEGPISMKRPTTRGFDGHYFNFPEESATYWMARFHLPSGASLELRGRYPHARYISLNAYSDGAPTDALSDVVIHPRRGSTNPFVAGHRRDLPKRSWRVRVIDQAPPAAGSPRARNTIYAQSSSGGAIELFYRVYEPDRGLDLTGATGLPRALLRLADGTLVRQRDACGQINDPDRSIPVQTTPQVQWEAGRNAPGCDGQTNPAYDPNRWERFFTYDFAALAVVTDCTQPGRTVRQSQTPEVKGGSYSNKDSAYIYSHLSRKFGPLLVVRGKLPWTPRTYGGEPHMQKAQMRFWSLCAGESRVTTYTQDCLADRQLPLSAGRHYTIVVSKPADRPANANRKCGVAWLEWPARGDGAGDPDYGLLIMRNMLVNPKFGHAIQRVTQAGTEQQVMGPYFPLSAYRTKQQFEQRGC